MPPQTMFNVICGRQMLSVFHVTLYWQGFRNRKHLMPKAWKHYQKKMFDRWNPVQVRENP